MAGDTLVATDAKKFRSQIRHIVGNMHVGTTMADVEAEMSRRVEKMRKQGADVTAAFVRGIKRIAKAEHKKNQQLYQDVMGGNVGRKRNPSPSPIYPGMTRADGKKVMAWLRPGDKIDLQVVGDRPAIYTIIKANGGENGVARRGQKDISISHWDFSEGRARRHKKGRAASKSRHSNPATRSRRTTRRKR